MLATPPRLVLCLLMALVCSAIPARTHNTRVWPDHLHAGSFIPSIPLEKGKELRRGRSVVNHRSKVVEGWMLPVHRFIPTPTTRFDSRSVWGCARAQTEASRDRQCYEPPRANTRKWTSPRSFLAADALQRAGPELQVMSRRLGYLPRRELAHGLLRGEQLVTTITGDHVA